MIIDSIVHVSNKNPLIISSTYRKWRDSLKLYPHPPERRPHHHSLWSWSLCPKWGAGAQVWPGHCASQRLCRLGCFFTSAVAYPLLCCGVGTARRRPRGTALCCFSKAASVVVSMQKLLQLLLAWKKMPLGTASLFAEEPVCGELFEPQKTSCLPPAPSHFVLPPVPFSHSDDFSCSAHLLQVLGGHLSVFTLPGWYFYPNA